MSAELSRRQRVTLQLGSSVLIAVTLLGLELGRWSPWSLPAVVAGYGAWVIVYAEVTVQVGRIRSGRRLLSAQTEPAPGDEHQASRR